ncbi:hypothetical protein ACE1TI_20580 [Alteribacillus sp. JSM 102045]|uniref:hypothetical protein n=1 Tax=Alteribacillus sp. JSM 102045 TaxID=1562101 RepID=UPI0035C23735
MGRWLAGAVVLTTFIVIGAGWLNWQNQTDKEWKEPVISAEEYDQDYTTSAEEKQEGEHTSEKIETKNQSELSLYDVTAPFEIKFQRIISKHQEEMETYLSEAKKMYQKKMPAEYREYYEIVDTYRLKADELEEQTDGLFEKQIKAMKEKLIEHGYDVSYAWEYEWEYESVKETSRMKYVRELITLNSFS